MRDLIITIKGRTMKYVVMIAVVAIIVTASVLWIQGDRGEEFDPYNYPWPDVWHVTATETFRIDTPEGAYVDGEIVLYEEPDGISGVLSAYFHYEEFTPEMGNCGLTMCIPDEFLITDVMTDYGYPELDVLVDRVPGHLHAVYIASNTWFPPHSRLTGGYCVVVEFEEFGDIGESDGMLEFMIGLYSDNIVRPVIELPLDGERS